MIIEEDLYIEHYGKQGMKWGVRRDPKTGVRPIARTLDKSRFGKAANANAQRSMERSRKRTNRTPEEKKARNKKIAIGVGVAAVGVYLAASFISAHGNRPVSSLPKTPSFKVENLIRQEHATQLSSLTRMHKEGKMDAAQFKNFSEILGKRYDRKLVEALV